jgi:hypothetical protein
MEKYLYWTWVKPCEYAQVRLGSMRYKRII